MWPLEPAGSPAPPDRLAFRILAAVDGSTVDEASLAQAARVGGAGAEIHLLLVVPPLPERLGAASAGRMEDQDRALARLRRLREGQPGVHGVDLLRTGDPADALAQAAKELGVDLVVLGDGPRPARGAPCRRGLPEALLRRTRVPVLFAAHDPILPLPPLRRILVPMDDSEDAPGVLASAWRTALRTGAVVLTVPAAALTAGAILGHAERLEADLIAMSTHARGESGRACVGETARIVLERARQPVLLHKTGVLPVVRDAWVPSLGRMQP